MKLISLLMLISLLGNTVFSQGHAAEFGLKAGVNFANFKLGEGEGKNKTGFHLGGLAHIHLSKKFALQPELVFSTQGSEYTDTRSDKFNYLNVPVILQYMFNYGFRIQTGPQFGFLASAKAKNGDVETDIDEDFKTLDVSWSFGGGYLSRSGLGVDARYNLGLTDISEGNPDIKNRVWQVGLFYQFKRK